MSDDAPNSFAHRREYAQILRQFISGRMTNFEYADRCDELEDRFHFDPATWAIYIAIWGLYDDNKRHRMTDARHRLDRYTRRRVAKFVLFLRSGSALSTRVTVDEPGMSGWRIVTLTGILLAVIALFAAAGTIAFLLLGVLMLVLMLSVTIVGRSVLSRSLVRAAWDPSHGDPWPFASAEDRLQAIATPTYLCGCT